MDALDRFFLHLVRTLRTSHPPLLSGAFDVAELYQTILPYRHHRRALGIETNQEYELTLLELLSGARGYLQVDERMRDALTQELATPNPDPARFRDFGSSQVMVAPGAADRIEATAAEGASGAATARAARPAQPPAAQPPAAGTAAGAAPSAARPSVNAPKAPAQAAPHAAPRAGGTAEVATVNHPSGMPRSPTPAGTAGRLSTPVHQRGVLAHGGDTCRYCSGELPAGRMVVFCPNCGQDLSIRNCPACGSELELGWRFCVSCGRSVAAEQPG